VLARRWIKRFAFVIEIKGLVIGNVKGFAHVKSVIEIK
jgi:hypothetical protein